MNSRYKKYFYPLVAVASAEVDTILLFKTIRLVRAAAWALAGAVAALAGSPAAAATVSLTPFGDLPGGAYDSRAYGVSGDGSVILGASADASGYHTVRWTAASGMQRMSDLLLANGVNPAADGWTQLGGSGVSADGNTIFGGGVRNGNSEAFRWTIGGPLLPVGDLPGGAFDTFYSGAFDVSGDGSVVVGESSVGFKDSAFTGKNEAFRWTSSGGIVGLGVLPGENFGTTARGVSADGLVVVGVAHTGESEHEAFRWTNDEGMVLLGDLPGGGVQSRADGVNHDGSILVGYGFSDAGHEAFRWMNDDGMVGLGIPDGILNSYGFDVSDDGSVVIGYGNNGTSLGFDGYDALIWTSETGNQRLWDLLLARGVNPAADGWTHLSFAEGISADGNTIVGNGIRNGNTEGFVAVIPEPSAMLLALPALCAVALLRRRAA